MLSLTRRRAVLLLVAALPGFGEGLSKGDRDRGLSELHGARKLTLDAVAGLTAAQWRFKPAPERWSIAEVMEHLVITERALLGMTRKLAASTPSSEPSPMKDDELLQMLTDRRQPVAAPETLAPTGRFGPGAENAHQYRTARDESLDFLRSTPEDLRRFRTKMPVGVVDGYQLLLYIAGHNYRHLAQIAEIKAHPNYPR